MKKTLHPNIKIIKNAFFSVFFFIFSLILINLQIPFNNSVSADVYREYYFMTMSNDDFDDQSGGTIVIKHYSLDSDGNFIKKDGAYYEFTEGSIYTKVDENYVLDNEGTYIKTDLTYSETVFGNVYSLDEEVYTLDNDGNYIKIGTDYYEIVPESRHILEEGIYTQNDNGNFLLNGENYYEIIFGNVYSKDGETYNLDNDGNFINYGVNYYGIVEGNIYSEEEENYTLDNDGDFLKAGETYYEIEVGNIYSFDVMEPSEVLGKDYLDKYVFSDGVEYVASIVANEGYKFAGLFLTDSESSSYFGNNYLVNSSGEYLFFSGNLTKGYYIAYFISEDSEVVFHNEFESSNDSDIVYDYTKISDELAETIYSNEATENGFILNVDINENLDFRVDLTRRGFKFDSISSSMFSEESNHYEYEVENSITYNNFSEENAVTYNLVIFPKIYEIQVDWNGQNYYNKNTFIIEDVSSFSGYYKNSVNEDVFISMLSNYSALIGFVDEDEADYDFLSQDTVFLQDDLSIVAVYDQTGIFTVKYHIADESYDRLVKTSYIDKFDGEGIVNEFSIEEAISQSEIFDSTQNFALQNVNNVLTYKYSYDGVLYNYTGAFDLDFTTTSNENLLEIFIYIDKDYWIDEDTAGYSLIETDNVYSIDNIYEFIIFANEVSGGNSFEGKTIELNADLNLSGKYWLPIGEIGFEGYLDNQSNSPKSNILYYLFPELLQTSHVFSTFDAESSSSITANPFKGVFDGNGHTIRNANILNYSLDKTEMDYETVVMGGGLFAFIEDGGVYNLDLENFYINGYNVAGALAGVIIGSEISNVSSSGNIVLNSFNSENELLISIGGISGLTYNTEFYKISSEVHVNVDDMDDCRVLQAVVGGISGYNLLSNIELSYFSGHIYFDSSSFNESISNFCGGIFGNALLSGVSNCYSVGEFELDGVMLGGISGDGGEISYCYSNPSVSYASVNAYESTIVNVYESSYSVKLPTVVSSYCQANGGINPVIELFSNSRSGDSLKEEETYEGWDFVNVWNIDELVNDGLPTLKIFGISDNIEIAQSEEDLYWIDEVGVLPSGVGTEEDPYLIASASNLVWILQSANNDDDNFLGKYFKQTADIDLDNKLWTPISSNIFTVETRTISSKNVEFALLKQGYGFSGFYDGDGFSISNLTMNSLVNNLGGLFGKVGNANFRNIVLDNVLIEGNSSIYSYDFDECVNISYSVGGLIAYSENAYITNCFVNDANISSYAYASENYYKTLNYLGAAVTPENLLQMFYAKNYLANMTCVGGLVGTSSDLTFIENCSSNSGSLSGFSVGGISGFCYSDVSFMNLENNGTEVFASVGGGIIGIGINTGSLIELFMNDFDLDELIIPNSIYSKEIRLAYCNNDAIISSLFVSGGICGISDAVIEKSFNSGSVNAFYGMTGFVYNGSITSLGSFAGGIAGYAQRIENCYNTGTISSFSNGSIYYEVSSAISAGICVRADYIYNCYNSGNVNSFYNGVVSEQGFSSSAVSSGILGYAIDNLEIINCINFGSIFSQSDVEGAVVGLFANSDLFNNVKIDISSNKSVVISKCYYDIYRCNRAVGYDANNTIFLESTVKSFTNSATYNSKDIYLFSSYWNGEKFWNFDLIWAEATDSLPILQKDSYEVEIVCEVEGITYTGDNYYTPGDLAVLEAYGVPSTSYAFWVLPNGQSYVGSSISFIFKYNLAGTYYLYVRQPESFEITAHFSDVSSETLYGDSFGIRENVVISLDGEIEYAGNNNYLKTGLVSGNRYLKYWTTQANGAGEIVDNNTSFLADTEIFAVWEIYNLYINVSVQNGSILGNYDNNTLYEIDDEFVVYLNSGTGYIFDGWYFEGSDVKIENLEQNINISVEDLLNIYISQIGSEVLTLKLVAKFVPNKVIITLVSSNENLGLVSFDGGDEISSFEDSVVLEVSYGSVVRLFAKGLDNNYFTYWVNNNDDDNIYSYIMNGAYTFQLTEDITFTANFAVYICSVTFNSTSGISLEAGSYGTSTIPSGDSLTYEFTPALGYYIHSVIIDGENLGSINAYTFENITENHSIVVVAKTYSVLNISMDSDSLIEKAYIFVEIENTLYCFSLKKGDSVSILGLNQLVNVTFSVSVSSRYGFYATINNSIVYNNSFSTAAYQNLEISMFADSLSYICG